MDAAIEGRADFTVEAAEAAATGPPPALLPPAAGARCGSSSSRSRPQALMGSRFADQLASSARWVLAALQSVQVPIVFHDGLPDVLHVFDKFASTLPAGHLEFGRAWLQRFPVTFDTRLLADEAAGSPPACPRSNESLEELHQRLWSPASAVPAGSPILAATEERPRFRELGPFTLRASSERLGIVARTGSGSVARKAMAVAEVFLRQMGSQIWAEAGEHAAGGAKRPCQVSHSLQPGSPPRKKRCCEGLGEESSPASDSSPGAGASPPAAGASPQPLGRRRRRGPDRGPARARSPEAEAVATAAALEALADKFAAGQGGALVREPCHEACRRFHNRLSAPGTPPGYLRLDTAVQVRLLRRLLRNEGCAQSRRLALALWRSVPCPLRKPAQAVVPAVPAAAAAVASATAAGASGKIPIAEVALASVGAMAGAAGVAAAAAA